MIGQTSLNLSDQLILLSGGAGEIGRVVALALVRCGAAVVVNDVLPESQARQWLPEGIGYAQADLTDPDAVDGMLESVVREHGRLPDTVCCHAGMVKSGPILQQSTEEFDQVFTTNTRSAYLLARACARGWVEAARPGHLIFTTSWVQDVPWPDIAAYIASKAAIKALMRSFARELAPQGIRANALAPGIVGVGMARRQWDTEPDYRQRASRAIPLGRLQTPESVADALVFLASGMAAYMTGSTLLVDGGASLYPMD